MQLKHSVVTFHLVDWSDFKDFVEATYGSRIFFPLDEERWHGERWYRARTAVLQDEDRKDLESLVSTADVRQAEVDNALELVMTDLCNKGLIAPGNYLFRR